MNLHDLLVVLQSQCDSKQKQLKEEVTSLTSEISSLEAEIVTLDSAAHILQDLIQRLSVSDLSELEKLISWGLQTVFELDYGFRITVETKRNTKVFSFVFLQDGKEVEMTSIGAGVQTVIALLLRLYVVAQLGAPRVLFLDEYFHNLDSERIPKFVEMVKALCQEYRFDVLVVTHYKDVVRALDTHYHLNENQELELRRELAR